jgi:hypothetical protein
MDKKTNGLKQYFPRNLGEDERVVDDCTNEDT